MVLPGIDLITAKRMVKGYTCNVKLSEEGTYTFIETFGAGFDPKETICQVDTAFLYEIEGKFINNIRAFQNHQNPCILLMLSSQLAN